jgi:hypothetical protein
VTTYLFARTAGCKDVAFCTPVIIDDFSSIAAGDPAALGNGASIRNSSSPTGCGRSGVSSPHAPFLDPKAAS